MDVVLALALALVTVAVLTGVVAVVGRFVRELVDVKTLGGTSSPGPM